MKITGVTTFLAHPGVGKNLCFVKIDTDEGIHGWGECYTQSDRDLQVVAHVDQLAPFFCISLVDESFYRDINKSRISCCDRTICKRNLERPAGRVNLL